MRKLIHPLTPDQISRIIEMAWDDLTPFEAIESQFQLSEQQVIQLMRTEIKRGSFRTWRKRVAGRPAKHQVRNDPARGEIDQPDDTE